MKYCKKCGKIENDHCEKCSRCKNSILSYGEPKSNFPVVIVRASGFEKQRICSALDNENLPYSTRIAEKQISADAVTGINNADYDILVPYLYYKRAIELLIGINAVETNENQLEFLEEISDKTENLQEDDYYSTKNRIVRIISVILLLVIVTGVVLGVDTVMLIIKGLFMT